MAALAVVVITFISNQNSSADGSQKSELLSSGVSVDNTETASKRFSSSITQTPPSPTLSNNSNSASSEVHSKSQTSSSKTSSSKTSSSHTNVPTITEKPEDKSIILTGYIIDEDCFVSVGYSDPSDETRGCLNMAICAASGYGLAVLQDGEKYNFYYFDGTISGVTDIEDRIDNATGGQKYAWDFIDQHIQNDNILVKVKGRFSGQKRTNPNIDTADGIYYDIFIVESIESA